LFKVVIFDEISWEIHWESGIVAEELLPGASTTGAADRVIGDLCSHKNI
jgi:hypothetical protein